MFSIELLACYFKMKWFLFAASCWLIFLVLGDIKLFYRTMEVATLSRD